MFAARLERVRGRLGAEGLSAFLVTSLSHDQLLPNVYYVSGFTGSTAALLITARRRFIITDSRYHEQVRQQVDPGFELVDNTGKKLLEEVLPVLAREHGLSRIAFDAANVTHQAAGKLASNGVDWVPVSGWVEELRAVKDEVEIGRIRAAVKLGEQVLTEVLGLIGPDATEADVAAEIEYRGLKLGAQGTSFTSIVATGANAAKPHAGFTRQKLVSGAPLTIDMGVRLDGYCSDMTRTLFVRDCPAKWAGIYSVVRQAKDLALAAVKPGMLGREVDAVARDYIAQEGYGEYFGHGLGHGVGIEVHEGPTLSRTSETPLAHGNVVSDEPGIYLPGEGGVRIEDLLLVTEQGAENLNTLSTSITVVG